MIDLGTIDFFIGTPSLPRRRFKSYSTRLFDEWEEHVSRTLKLADYSLSLEVEEGSVKGVGKIATVLGTLWAGIATYGSFVQGIQIIRSQVSAVGDYLAEQASSPFEARGYETRVQRHGGSLAHLQRLFAKVQRREMTTEQAMLEAETLFGDEVATAPQFMYDLQESLEQPPLVHEQLPLLPDTTEQDSEFSAEEKKRKSRPSSQIPTAPPPQHLRIEVWRDSKNGKRRVRVVQL